MGLESRSEECNGEELLKTRGGNRIRIDPTEKQPAKIAGARCLVYTHLDWKERYAMWTADCYSNACQVPVKDSSPQWGGQSPHPDEHMTKSLMDKIELPVCMKLPNELYQQDR